MDITLRIPAFWILLVIVCAAMAASSATPASAGGFTVNMTTDAVDADLNDGVCDSDLGADGLQCTLRAAVQQANADIGLDVINLPGDTITLTIPGAEDAGAAGDLDILDSVSFVGAGEEGTVIQAGATRGSGIDRVFHISSGTVHFSDLTIRHGNAPGARGGGIWNLGTLTLDNVTIASNDAANGGGIFNEGGSLDAADSTFKENEAESDGGGLYNESGPASLQNVDVTDNLAGSNGAGLNSEGSGATLLVSDSTISGNIVATGFNGGGIDAEGTGGTLTVVDSIIVGNQTGSNGGGIYVFGTTSFSLFGSSVTGNSAGSNGGGVYYGASTGDVSLSDSAITGNSAGSSGGGLYSSGDALLVNLTISGNTAGSDGGGVHVRSVTTILNNTIAGNTADFDGNGTGDGGGIYVQDVAGQVANLKQSIVAQNSDPSSDPDCWGVVNSMGYNLIQVVSAGCDISGDTASNITGQDPLLGPLADNGGPTQTRALLPGSPAIDAVLAGCPPPPGDQRGVERPQGPACDIGAYELEATATATPTPTDTPTPSPTSGSQLLWGDSDCDGEVSSRDNQALLRNVLQQTPLSQTEPCPDLGTVLQRTGGPLLWGDWDCDGEVSSRDNQALLRFVLQQPALSQTEPCPDIGVVLT